MAGDPCDETRGAARSRFWPVVLGAGLAASAVVGALVLLVGLPGGHPATTAAVAKAAPAGCQLSQSPYGYPGGYLSRTLPPRKHPPLPASGWHGPAKPLRFDLLFHSVFHGYLVITYRPDLPRTARLTLRAWVLAHSNQRVVGSPNATPGAPLLDFVEWGWQLRCADAVPSIAKLDRFADHRNTGG
jgi:Protein of unknown function (DUF3105)